MDTDKQELEKEKLQLEIAKLKTHWFKNIELWKVAIPTLAIIVSLYFTFGKGALDAQKDKLEIQKEQLKLEILTFENQKKELTNSISLSKDELNQTNENVIELRLMSDSLKRQVGFYKKKIDNQAKTYNAISGRLTRDKEFYLNELTRQYDVEKSYLKRISQVDAGLQKSNDTNELINLELTYYRNKVKLTESELRELLMLKSNKEIELADKRIDSYNQEMRRLEAEFKNNKGKYNNMSAEDLERFLELRYRQRDDDNK